MKDELQKTRAGWEGQGKSKGGKLHQFLTPELGHPRLREHIEGVIMIMRFSKTWGEMLHRMDDAYPKLNTTPRLPFPDDAGAE